MSDQRESCVVMGPAVVEGRMIPIPCVDRRCFLAGICALIDDARELHHHHDEFCQLPTNEELLAAGIDPKDFKARSRR